MDKIKFIALYLLLPLLIPPAVFTICGFAEGMSPVDVTTSLAEQFTTRRQNLFLCGILGLFPVLLLLAVLWVYRRAGGTERTRRWMAPSGLIAIALILTWTNLQFWPIFLPERTYPGFPHGLEFVIGPLIFAPIAMLPVMFITWWTTHRRG